MEEDKDFLYKTENICTYDEYVKFNNAQVKPLKRIIITAGFTIMTCFVVTGRLLGALLGAVLYALFIAVLMLFLYPRSIKKSWESNKLMQNIRAEIYFYEEYFKSINENGYSDVRYENIYKILETDTNFYIFIGTNAAVVVIKENCSDGLINFLREKKDKIVKKKK